MTGDAGRSPTRRAGGTVLVVDSDALASAYAEALEEWGYQVHRARDVDDALSRIAAIGVDLVLASSQLASNGGPHLLESLANLANGPSVIILSGSPSERAIGNPGGAVNCGVRRPVALFELREKVDQVLAERRLRSKRNSIFHRLNARVGELERLLRRNGSRDRAGDLPNGPVRRLLREIALWARRAAGR